MKLRNLLESWNDRDTETEDKYYAMRARIEMGYPILNDVIYDLVDDLAKETLKGIKKSKSLKTVFTKVDMKLDHDFDDREMPAPEVDFTFKKKPYTIDRDGLIELAEILVTSAEKVWKTYARKYRWKGEKGITLTSYRSKIVYSQSDAIKEVVKELYSGRDQNKKKLNADFSIMDKDLY